MTERTTQKEKDQRDFESRQEDSIFSSHEGKLATASPSGGGRDAYAIATIERPDLLILLGLAVVTFGIYAQVIGHRFTNLDDPLYITENSMVNRGVTLDALAWAFTTFHVAYWHPLTWIAHMIDSQLFGMFAGGHLIVNALIHVANTLLVFWFLLGTTRARWPSALVAALFALHPLHVESVAWAAERKDTLSTFFGLLSLIAYVRYAEASSIRRYAWVAITLALGLMSKPMLVTWPFVMLLLDYWPLGRFSGEHTRPRVLFSAPRRKSCSVRREPASGALGGGAERSTRGACAPQTSRLLVEKIPLFALVGASAIITFVAQSHNGAVRTLAHEPIALRLSNALVSYAKYLLRAFWPNDLAVYYPFPEAGIPAWQIIGAALLLIGITAFCFFQRKSRPYLIVGWLWFLGTLVPVIGLVQVGAQTMADRFFYIPSIGLFIALVFGLADIAERRRVAPWLGAAITGVVLLVLATLTNAQVHRWRDSFTLFEHTLAVTPPNRRIEYDLGVAFAERNRYDEAAPHFEKALQIRPNDYMSLLYMGITRFHQGRLPEAIEYAQVAIRSQADSPRAHDLLGMALAKQNRNDAALDEMRRAVELAPKDADIRNDLGLALAQLGRIPEAIDEFREAVRLDPDKAASAHANLGWALLTSGKASESIPEFEAALHLQPQSKAAADGLRQAQAQLSPQR
jgi:protein O-mannosyl-transferase